MWALCIMEKATWFSNKSLDPKANSTAKYICNVQLARKSPLSCHLHLFEAKPKLRKDKSSSKAGRNHTAQKSYRLGSKEPWLLATNLPPEYFSSAKVVELYAKCMQIEETFRDLKSPQYGIGLRQSRSRCPKRYDVLLLIAMLAEILLWCIGIAARHLGWQKDFQANSIKHRAVLSVVRLGKEVRRRPTVFCLFKRFVSFMEYSKAMSSHFCQQLFERLVCLWQSLLKKLSRYV